MQKTFKRIRKRSVRARATLVVAALVLAGLAVTGLLSPWWLAPLAYLAIAAAAVLGRRRRRFSSRLAKTRPRQADDAMAMAEAVAAALPDPAILMDLEGRIVVQNGSAEEFFGARAPGSHVSSAIRAPQVLDAIDRARQTGERVHVDYAIQVPVERHFEALVTPVDGRGRRSLLLLLRDLTRQERAERMRAEFVANASHELRTPLASLLGFVETLQGPAKSDPHSRDRFLEIMRSEAVRMSRLIDDLLSLSRIELNAHVLPRGRVDIGAAVAHVADTLRPIAREAGVEIVMDAGPERLEVQGERDELVQVFQNIVENAIKYGRDGKRVEIGVRAGADTVSEGAPPRVRVSVRDHGPGIAPEHIPRLTERFYRVDKSHSREMGGTGLGLAIVKHILNRHGGRLVVESEVGRGAEFSVVLPLAEIGESGRLSA